LPGAIEPSKLLVADDHLPRAESIAAYLSEHGFETRAVDDGGEAIIVAETWPADAAVLSIPLASVPGTDVALHLRESFGSSFRLVACSPMADSTSSERLAAFGFDEVVLSGRPDSILLALGQTTRLLVERSMRQTVRRIELLVVLGHSLLGSRNRASLPENVVRVSRIVEMLERDVAALALPKERGRLARELGALAERVPDPRITRF
jgi:CheY-like chemotaxis protein